MPSEIDFTRRIIRQRQTAEISVRTGLDRVGLRYRLPDLEEYRHVRRQMENLTCIGRASAHRKQFSTYFTLYPRPETWLGIEVRASTKGRSVKLEWVPATWREEDWAFLYGLARDVLLIPYHQFINCAELGYFEIAADVTGIDAKDYIIFHPRYRTGNPKWGKSITGTPTQYVGDRAGSEIQYKMYDLLARMGIEDQWPPVTRIEPAIRCYSYTVEQLLEQPELVKNPFAPLRIAHRPSFAAIARRYRWLGEDFLDQVETVGVQKALFSIKPAPLRATAVAFLSLAQPQWWRPDAIWKENWPNVLCVSQPRPDVAPSQQFVIYREMTTYNVDRIQWHSRGC